MRKNIYKVITALSASAVVLVGFTVSGSSFGVEKPMAGITLSLDKYCDGVIADAEKEEQEALAEEKKAEAETVETATEERGDVQLTKTASSTTIEKTDKKADADEVQEDTSHLKLNLNYSRLGVANVKNYLNVRKNPSENSKIVGKMTKNSGCHIYKVKKGWAKIVSGKVRGWVKSEFLLKDEAAEKRAKKVATLRATVNTETLNVRALPTTDSRVYDQISADEEYTIGNRNITKAWLERYMAKYTKRKDLKGVTKSEMYKDLDNWVMLKIDEEKVFVSKDFIKVTYNLNRAVSIKEERLKKGSDDSSSSSSNYSMVDYAMQFLGNRYVWGGTSLTNGTDCSGFTMRIYEHFGYSIPRTSSAQAAYTRSVSSSEVQVGDLFFYGSGSVSHVAMYIGNGQIIHASNARDGIKISSAYYRQPLKIGRVK